MEHDTWNTMHGTCQWVLCAIATTHKHWTNQRKSPHWITHTWNQNQSNKDWFIVKWSIEKKQDILFWALFFNLTNSKLFWGMHQVFLPCNNLLFKKGRDREVSHDIKHQLGCSIMIQICFLFIGKQEQREVTHDTKQGLEAILSRLRKFTETNAFLEVEDFPP